MFNKTSQEVLDELSVDRSVGLSSQEAKSRLEKNGKNALVAKPPKSLLRRIFDSINDPMIYILLAAAIASIVMDEVADAVIILVVVVVNSVVGLIQENKAQKSLEALKKMASPKTLVKRNGVLVEIDIEDVVVGDIINIEAGRFMPADLRLLEAANLKIDESALTGESVPVEKISDAIENEQVGLGDQKNMAFMSTYSTYGRGEGVVVATGMDTQIGKIAKMLDDEEDQLTPLQIKLAGLSKILGIGCVVVCLLILGVGVWQGRDFAEMLMIAISLAVAIIPEGLVAIVTIVLALGVERMSKKNAIVKRLPAVETLGSVNVICSDKTGTITQNKMTVTHIYQDGLLKKANEMSDNERFLVNGFMLCCDATNEESRTGDPTEIALLDMGSYLSISKTALDKQYLRFDEIPFDSDRKLMTTVHHYDGKDLVFTKGALDILLSKSTHILFNGQIKEITGYKDAILDEASKLSNQALRVLALAYKDYSSEAYEDNLTFVGLVGMIDPARDEVKEAIEVARNASIATVMITGDHQDTAFAIAREVGICTNPEQVMNGHTLSQLTQEQLNEIIENYRVFARVQPEHKVMIVKAFQSKGYVVSMTGDGVNDAPSLKAANIGVSMGITGTDVAKEASEMILTDDNFVSIVHAVEEGRNIYNNIKKSIMYLLSCNLGEVSALFTAILLNWQSPLRAMHILWVNLVTDTLPALALGVDPGSKEVMNRKPNKQDESIFAGGGWFYIIVNGIFIGALTLIAFVYGESKYGMNTEEIMHAQTMAFMVLSVSQLFHSFNTRSFTESIFKVGVFKNKFLVLSFIVGLALQVTVVVVPPLADIFGLFPLSLQDWAFTVGLSFLVIPFNEILKIFRRGTK